MSTTTIYEGRPTYDEMPSRQRAGHRDIIEEDFWEAYEIAKPYSLLHVSGFYSIYKSLRYVAAAGVRGDIVECGVFLGGSAIFAALVRDKLGLTDRKVYLYDSFEGFPEGSADTSVRGYVKGPKMANFSDKVRTNVAACGLDAESMIFVPGFVEQTLVGQPLPAAISLLRLDTDFYDSTKIELQVLYPRLVRGGVLIVDDYGYYEGSRRATDEILGDSILLHRIDSTIRAGTKI